MKIKWQGFLGQNHSWSVVAQNISRELIRQNHDVDLISTNGLDYIPQDLSAFIKASPKGKYDMQLSYTAMKNFPQYLSDGDQNRFGIWCYEFVGKNSLPSGFAKNHKYCDLLLPPSKFAKDIFLESGVPEDKLKVLPHGINSKKFLTVDALDLKLTQKVRILVNIAQPHIRKNIRGLLSAYGEAFTSKDDVVLVLKVVDKKPQQAFEVSFSKEFELFRSKYKNHAQVKLVKDFIPDIESIYKSCNVTFTMTHSECFFFSGSRRLGSGAHSYCP